MTDRYPRAPRPAVLAVVPRQGARGPELLLVRRAHKPDPDRWGFPGGKIELGEDLMTAALRELQEETGLSAVALAPIWAGDVIRRDITNAVVYHFVLTAVLCRWRSGDGQAADDATEAEWMTLDELRGLPEGQIFPDVLRVARLALGIFDKTAP